MGFLGTVQRSPLAVQLSMFWRPVKGVPVDVACVVHEGDLEHPFRLAMRIKEHFAPLSVPALAAHIAACQSFVWPGCACSACDGHAAVKFSRRVWR